MGTEDKPVFATDGRWEDKIDHVCIRGIFWRMEMFYILTYWLVVRYVFVDSANYTPTKGKLYSL